MAHINLRVDISGAECWLLLASIVPHWKGWSPNFIWPDQTTDFACCTCRMYGWATQTVRCLLLLNIFFKETCYNNLLNYLLIAWSRILLQKPTVFQLGKKFPPFYGTRRFITTFRSAVTCPSAEPDRSSSSSYIPRPEDPS